MSLDAGDPDGLEQASALLAEMAGALLTTDPRRQQIVLPADSEPSHERSQVHESTEGLLVIDERLVIVGLNPAAERLFGHTREGVLGHDAGLLFTTDLEDGPPALAVVTHRGSVAKTLTVSPQLLGRHRDGTTLPLAVQVSELVLAEGPRFVLSVQDLTEQRQRDKSLRSAAARYRALVEQIPAVTFMAALDDGENEMYVSPQIEALLGYSQKEWLDDPVLWFYRLHPDDREMWNREFARGIATGGPFRAECRVMARDGRVVWIHGEARLVRDDAGRPLFLQGIAFDISESKRAEQELRETQEHKARHERLAAIGQLAASIGHDLRNPLAAIRNAHYYVGRRLAATELAKDARIAQMLQVIERELLASNKIISDLLDFARERRTQRAPCPLAALVADSLSIVQAPKHVQLVNEVADTLPVLDLDRDQMRQVIVNLAQNGAEAIPAERPGLVVIRAEATAGEILLSIADNGEGIPPENLAKILEPLFTTKERGTGLGLAIVTGIIKRHGGTLEVRSERQIGTTFTVRLPRTAATEPKP